MVDGRVQGVGFRMFVLDLARQYDLTGWVRNTYAGQVEVLAEGPRTVLELLLEDLNRGPRGSWVESIRQDWQAATGEYKSFEVVRTI